MVLVKLQFTNLQISSGRVINTDFKHDFANTKKKQNKTNIDDNTKRKEERKKKESKRKRESKGERKSSMNFVE